MSILTRRALLMSAVMLAPAARLRAFARHAPAVAPTTLDEFLELSQRLLGRAKLDPEVGQIYLNALLADADTTIYLATLVQSNGNPTPEQRAVADTIIEWWYTGVYIGEGRPRLATHAGALMWSALGIPAPGTCSGPFGAWSRPPETIA
jgi:hypothetical protein